MIDVMVGGQTLKITPKRLLDYCEKIDFIKMRRGNAATLVEGFPEGMTEQNYKILVGIAMERCCRIRLPFLSRRRLPSTPAKRGSSMTCGDACRSRRRRR